MNVFLYLLAGMLTFGTNTQKISSESYQKEMTCLKISEFNSLSDYIKKYGKQIKLSKRLLSDEKSLALEISFGNRYIELEDYQDYERIIVIDKSKSNNIPPYFVSNAKNQVQISAYYSRFDLEKDVKFRNHDWCRLISEFNIQK